MDDFEKWKTIISRQKERIVSRYDVLLLKPTNSILAKSFFFNYNNKDINDCDRKKILLNTLNNTEANT